MLEVQRILFILRRWWWLLLAALLVGGLVAYGLTKVLVQQQYESTATVAMAPPPQGPNGLYITLLSASADAQLVATRSTANAAVSLLPASVARSVGPSKLATDITGAASLDGQLLFVTVRWHAPALAMSLANATAGAFIRQERRRLEAHYRIIHAGLAAQERHLASLGASVQSSGQPAQWLQAQYADAASKIYQQDADARIQAATQQASLQLAQPATTVQKVGPKPTVNGLLGAVLAGLIALVFAFAATSSYGEAGADEDLHPVLTKVGD